MATRDAVKRNVTKLLIAISLLGLALESAHASGFALRESSARAMGTSYAGAAAVDFDPSYLVYNPASLSNVQVWDASFNITGLLLDSNGKFAATTTIGTPTGGDSTPHRFVGDALVPAFSVRYRLNDRWAIGVAFSTPWGESTSYPATWTGRYYAIGTSLVAYDVTTVVSYQLSPQLTVAAGAQIQYLRSHLTEAIDFGTLGALNHIPGAVPGTQDGRADLHGHSWGAGYVLGARWRVTPAVALGISYRSEIHQALKGTERFVYDGAGIAATINSLTGAFAQSAGQAELPTPAVVTAGVQWSVDDCWTLLGGVEFTNWNSLHQLLISVQQSCKSKCCDYAELEKHLVWLSRCGIPRRRALDFARRHSIRRAARRNKPWSRAFPMPTVTGSQPVPVIIGAIVSISILLQAICSHQRARFTRQFLRPVTCSARQSRRHDQFSRYVDRRPNRFSLRRFTRRHCVARVPRRGMTCPFCLRSDTGSENPT